MTFFDFFRCPRTGKPSGARLFAFIGLLWTGINSTFAIHAWIWAHNPPDMAVFWFCIAPGLIGISPLVFQYIFSFAKSEPAKKLLEIWKTK